MPPGMGLILAVVSGFAFIIENLLICICGIPLTHRYLSGATCACIFCVCIAFTLAFCVRAAHLFFRFGFLYNNLTYISFIVVIPLCDFRANHKSLPRNQITNKHSNGKTKISQTTQTSGIIMSRTTRLPPIYTTNLF